MIADVFLDQKRVNVCEHAVKTVPHESGGDGGKIEWKSSQVNTRAVTRGQNKLIREFKIAVADVISIRGRL